MPLTPLAIFQFASALICGVCTFQMLLLMSNYWHTMMPLRREVGSGTVVAPPVVWTFLYHTTVFLLLAFLCVGRIQLAFSSHQVVTVATFAIPILVVALSGVTSQFQRYYSRLLYEEARRRSGHPPRTGPGPVNEA